jgi:ABC-type transport system substrate-binding protein
VIQQNLSDVGIEMDLHSVSFSEWIDKGESGQTQTGMFGWTQDYPDPSNFLDVQFNSDQIPANNASYYSNPTVDKELAQALSMEDESQRLALYQKIQKQILADNPVLLFMKGTPEAPRCGFSMRVVGVVGLVALVWSVSARLTTR